MKLHSPPRLRLLTTILSTSILLLAAAAIFALHTLNVHRDNQLKESLHAVAEIIYKNNLEACKRGAATRTKLNEVISKLDNGVYLIAIPICTDIVIDPTPIP